MSRIAPVPPQLAPPDVRAAYERAEEVRTAAVGRAAGVTEAQLRALADTARARGSPSSSGSSWTTRWR